MRRDNAASPFRPGRGATIAVRRSKREAMTRGPASMAAEGPRRATGETDPPVPRGAHLMRTFVSRLVALAVLVGSMLMISAGSVAGHCLTTPAGMVDLSPGHLAAAHGHVTAINSSGILLATCPDPETFPYINAASPTGSTVSPH